MNNNNISPKKYLLAFLSATKLKNIVSVCRQKRVQFEEWFASISLDQLNSLLWLPVEADILLIINAVNQILMTKPNYVANTVPAPILYYSITTVTNATDASKSLLVPKSYSAYAHSVDICGGNTVCKSLDSNVLQNCRITHRISEFKTQYLIFEIGKDRLRTILQQFSGGKSFDYFPYCRHNVVFPLWLLRIPIFSSTQYMVALLEVKIWQAFERSIALAQSLPYVVSSNDDTKIKGIAIVADDTSYVGEQDFPIRLKITQILKSFKVSAQDLKGKVGVEKRNEGVVSSDRIVVTLVAALKRTINTEEDILQFMIGTTRYRVNDDALFAFLNYSVAPISTAVVQDCGNTNLSTPKKKVSFKKKAMMKGEKDISAVGGQRKEPSLSHSHPQSRLFLLQYVMNHLEEFCSMYQPCGGLSLLPNELDNDIMSLSSLSHSVNHFVSCPLLHVYSPIHEYYANITRELMSSGADMEAELLIQQCNKEYAPIPKRPVSRKKKKKRSLDSSTVIASGDSCMQGDMSSIGETTTAHGIVDNVDHRCLVPTEVHNNAVENSLLDCQNNCPYVEVAVDIIDILKLNIGVAPHKITKQQVESTRTMILIQHILFDIIDSAMVVALNKMVDNAAPVTAWTANSCSDSSDKSVYVAIQEAESEGYVGTNAALWGSLTDLAFLPKVVDATDVPKADNTKAIESAEFSYVDSFNVPYDPNNLVLFQPPVQSPTRDKLKYSRYQSLWSDSSSSSYYGCTEDYGGGDNSEAESNISNNNESGLPASVSTTAGELLSEVSEVLNVADKAAGDINIDQFEAIPPGINSDDMQHGIKNGYFSTPLRPGDVSGASAAGKSSGGKQDAKSAIQLPVLSQSYPRHSHLFALSLAWLQSEATCTVLLNQRALDRAVIVHHEKNSFYHNMSQQLMMGNSPSSSIPLSIYQASFENRQWESSSVGAASAPTHPNHNHWEAPSVENASTISNDWETSSLGAASTGALGTGQVHNMFPLPVQHANVSHRDDGYRIPMNYSQSSYTYHSPPQPTPAQHTLTAPPSVPNSPPHIRNKLLMVSNFDGSDVPCLRATLGRNKSLGFYKNVNIDEDKSWLLSFSKDGDSKSTNSSDQHMRDPGQSRIRRKSLTQEISLPQKTLKKDQAKMMHRPSVTLTSSAGPRPNSSNPAYKVVREVSSNSSTESKKVSSPPGAAPHSPVIVTPIVPISCLSFEINQFVQDVDAWEEGMRSAKLTAIVKVGAVVKSLWPRAQVKSFGSFMTDLSLPSSDVDVVICLPNVQLEAGPEAPGMLEGRNAVKESWQRHLLRCLSKEPWVDRSSIKVIANTLVPVLKFKTVNLYQSSANSCDGESPSGIVSMDISFEDSGLVHRGVRACKYTVNLLKTHSFLRPLVLVLKQFLMSRSLGESYTGGLSSYALLLLVTRYLQELLQKNNITTPTASKCPSSSATNSLMYSVGDVGSIFLGLLQFYGGCFEPLVHGISVLSRYYFIRGHNPSAVPSPQNVTPLSNSFSHRTVSATSNVPFKFDPLFIEDPLTPENNVGRNCFRIYQVQRCFNELYCILIQSMKHPQLDDAGPERCGLLNSSTDFLLRHVSTRHPVKA